MSVNPQDHEVLSVAREQLFSEVTNLLSGQKYIDAVLLIEDIIGISKKIGDQVIVNEYNQKIADCIERFKSIQDDIEILKADEGLRAEIEEERTSAIIKAQEAAKNEKTKDAIELYERAIEFSLKLTDKKNIWKLSKSINILREKLPPKAHAPLSIPTGSQANEIQPPPTVPTITPQPAVSAPPIPAPTPPPTPTISEITPSLPQIIPPMIDSTPEPAASLIPPVPQIGPPKPPISSALSPPIAPIPQLEAAKTPSAAPITSVDAAASILGVEESEPESTDSFLDAIVEDLKEQPSSTVVEPPTQSVEQMVPFVPSIPEPIPLTKSTEQQIPFVPQPIDSQEIEEEESSEEDVKDIFDTEDKKLRKKLALAEKIAQKKLEEAEKMFKKEAKKEEKKKEKEFKKQLKDKKQEEDENKPEKLTKKDEKLKSKYPSAMPDDVLSAIRSRKRDDES